MKCELGALLPLGLVLEYVARIGPQGRKIMVPVDRRCIRRHTYRGSAGQMKQARVRAQGCPCAQK